jgi:hypothetical protein
VLSGESYFGAPELFGEITGCVSVFHVPVPSYLLSHLVPLYCVLPVCTLGVMLTTETIANKLNYLLQDPDIKPTIQALLGLGVPASKKVIDHPTICVEVHPDGLRASMGFLGLLNGVLRLCDQPVLVAHLDSDTEELLYFSAKVVREPQPEPTVVN